MTETRSPSTALVEVVLANSSDPLTSREIADRTRVAHTTVWRGVETLRENGAVVPVDTGERVISHRLTRRLSAAHRWLRIEL